MESPANASTATRTYAEDCPSTWTLELMKECAGRWFQLSLQNQKSFGYLSKAAASCSNGTAWSPVLTDSLNQAGGSMRHWNLQNGSARDFEWRKMTREKHREAICLHRENQHNINTSFKNRSGGKPPLTDVGSRTLLNSDMFLQLPWHSTLLKWNGFKWYKNAQNNLPLNRRCKRLPVGSRQVGDLEFVTLAGSKFTSPSVVPHIQHGTSTSIFLPIKDAMQRWVLKLSCVQNLYQHLLPERCFFWTFQFKSVLLHQKVQTALQLLLKNI